MASSRANDFEEMLIAKGVTIKAYIFITCFLHGKDYEFPFKIAAQRFLTCYVVLVDTIEVVIELYDQGEPWAIIDP